MTAEVFEAIRQAKPTRLYVAADGPRVDNFEDYIKVDQVRKIATAVDWNCELKTLFRDINIGCGTAVKTAIDWFFSHEEYGIILEDDTVPNQDFFWFCDELLVKYKLDQRVGMIAGVNHVDYIPTYGSYLFSRNKACWGWATWKRAWEKMDIAMNWRKNPQSGSILSNMGYTYLHKKHWNRALNLIDKREVNAWDWQWYFSIASQNQLTIFPCVNLVANTGFGDDSTHTKGKPISEYINTKRLEFPIVHPNFICPDFKYETMFEKKRMSEVGCWRRFIPRKIKSMLRKHIR